MDTNMKYEIVWCGSGSGSDETSQEACMNQLDLQDQGGCFCRLKLIKTSQWYKLVVFGINWF